MTAVLPLQNLHAAAAAALTPSQDLEGGGGSTIPAASLQPLQTATVSVAADTTTLLPTVDVQVIQCTTVMCYD